MRDKNLIFIHLYSANSTIRFSNAPNKEIIYIERKLILVNTVLKYN